MVASYLAWGGGSQKIRNVEALRSAANSASRISLMSALNCSSTASWRTMPQSRASWVASATNAVMFSTVVMRVTSLTAASESDARGTHRQFPVNSHTGASEVLSIQTQPAGLTHLVLFDPHNPT